jgi:3-oxoacyl-[acyl-carrier protein] reductase
MVAPALIESDALQDIDADKRLELAGRVPVGRQGKAEEVADLILALMQNPYLTGQSISIDGGIYPC